DIQLQSKRGLALHAAGETTDSGMNLASAQDITLEAAGDIRLRSSSGGLQLSAPFFSFDSIASPSSPSFVSFRSAGSITLDSTNSSSLLGAEVLLKAERDVGIESAQSDVAVAAAKDFNVRAVGSVRMDAGAAKLHLDGADGATLS